MSHFKKITARCKLHNDTESWWGVIIETLLIANDELAIVWCKNSDFVKSIFTLFLFHGSEFNLRWVENYFFHSVDLSIKFTFDFEDLSKSTLTKFVEDLEIFESCWFLHYLIKFFRIMFSYFYNLNVFFYIILLIYIYPYLDYPLTTLLKIQFST